MQTCRLEDNKITQINNGCFLGFYTVGHRSFLMFHRNVLPPSSVWQSDSGGYWSNLEEGYVGYTGRWECILTNQSYRWETRWGLYQANGEVTVPKMTLFRVNCRWCRDGWMGGWMEVINFICVHADIRARMCCLRKPGLFSAWRLLANWIHHTVLSMILNYP